MAYFGQDPTLEYNRLMGQLVILTWELCDCLTLMRVPHSAMWPLKLTPWTLADFEITNAVRLFRYLLFSFPLLSP